MSHWLVIHEQGGDYDIEHEEPCPKIALWDGPDGEPILGEDCLIGTLWREAGPEILDIGLEDARAWPL